MAFGFFKKKETADTILVNGKFITADPEVPQVEALALRNGRIQALGDREVLEEELTGPDTEIVDLQGMCLMPGLILAPAQPVLDSFRSLCLMISPQWNRDTIKDEVGKALRKKAGLLGYGFSAALLKDLDPEQMRKELDQVSPIKPIVLLSSDGIQVWLNTPAIEKARRVAEEEEVSQITLPFLVGALDLIDTDQLQEQVLLQSGEYCKMGITALWDTGAPDYFHSLYHEALVALYQEGFLKQRFYGSVYMDRDVDPKGLAQKLMQNRTLCNEMNGLVHFTTLHLLRDEKIPEGFGLSREGLEALATAASDRNFHLLLQVRGSQALQETLETMDRMGRAGGRTPWILSTDAEISSELRQEIGSIEEWTVIPDMDFEDKIPVITGKPMEEILDTYLQKPAMLLGEEDVLGRLEPGSHADFVVFDQNPENKEAKVRYTFLDGQLVYDATEDRPEKWYHEFLEQWQQEEEE